MSGRSNTGGGRGEVERRVAKGIDLESETWFELLPCFY